LLGERRAAHPHLAESALATIMIVTLLTGALLAKVSWIQAKKKPDA
jgi:hypothetical protein